MATQPTPPRQNWTAPYRKYTVTNNAGQITWGVRIYDASILTMSSPLEQTCFVKANYSANTPMRADQLAAELYQKEVNQQLPQPKWVGDGAAQAAWVWSDIEGTYSLRIQ